MDSVRIGEVIESTTDQIVAECYELHSPPSLGSLVKAGDGNLQIYGLVSGARTESMDPGRRPLARGRNNAEDEDVYRQNPQLSKLLRTTFTVLIAGYEDAGRIYQYLSPRPPRVHSFVFQCGAGEVRCFTQNLDFLPTLLSAGNSTVDDIICACLRQASLAHEDPRAFLVRAGKELALMLSGELNRLNVILRRIKP